MDLQLFAGEKTETATPRRREEARKKGQVTKSNELVSVLVITLTLLGIRALMPGMMSAFQDFFSHVLTYTQTDLSVEKAFQLLLEVLYLIVRMAAPILLIALVAGYCANVVQVGFLFTTEPLKLDVNRLNPVSGFRRIFSKRALVELVKSVAKTVLVGYVAFSYLWKQLPGIAVLMDAPFYTSVKMITNIIYGAGWRVLGVLFVLAVADYAFQLYDYEQSLKMSKQEIKDEYKTMEGDPQLKARIKEKQRQMSARRMMRDVPKATVVITNPTHFAIALKYEEGMSAPLVVAKGQDLLAQRIKELASENSVTIVENVNLARILYKRVEIGMMIPADLYSAVAEVIAYVYRLKKRI